MALFVFDDWLSVFLISASRSCRRDNPGEVLVLEEHPLDPSKVGDLVT